MLPTGPAYRLVSWTQQPGGVFRFSTLSDRTCAPSSRPVTNAAFMGHTSSRCDMDSSEKMQLRIVHSPDSCTCGSYPSCLSLLWTASCRASFVRACRRISSPRLSPTAVATSRSDSAPSAPGLSADKAAAIIEAASAYRVCGISTEKERDESE